MFLFFIRQKRKRVEEEGETVSAKSQALAMWIKFVLFINSVDFISYVIVQILIEVDYLENEGWSTIYEIYKLVCIFWVDLLCITNGLCFLVLFQKMGKSKN